MMKNYPSHPMYAKFRNNSTDVQKWHRQIIATGPQQDTRHKNAL